MIVRDVRPSDLTQWLPLWRGYLAFYESNLPHALTQITFRRLNNPVEPMFGLVAEQDGALIGFTNCILHRGTWTAGDHCYLEDLFVAPSARGQGAARALIDAVYARADTLKCERVYWLTHETNEAAQRLYDKIARRSGFIQYRRP
jgi:GNAT superfamily N-acetyltransferase